MAQYSHRTFLRRLSDELLDEFFRKHEDAEGPPSIETSDDSADFFLKRLEALPKENQRQAEFELRQVYGLACEEGVKALIDEGNFKKKELSCELESLDLPDKAMRTLLSYPDVFRVASRIHEARKLSSRHWRTRRVPIVAPDVSPLTVRRLAQTISEQFWAKEGRGRHSNFERYLVNDIEHFVFVYLDDYAGNYLGFDDANELIRRPERRAFEVVFIYNAATGSLELFATGEKKHKEALFQAFATIVLGISLPDEDREQEPFDLNCLKSRQFGFPSEPSDGIERVRVRELKVTPLGWPEERITFDAGGRNDKTDARAMIETYLDQKRLSPDGVRVSGVTLEFRLARIDDRRPMKFSFDVSPRSCNLKSHPEPQRLLGEKYLRRWKIVRS